MAAGCHANDVPVSLRPQQSAESVLLTTVAAGTSYTAIVRGKGAATGVALIEVYDLNPVDGSVLANVSTRGLVGTTEDVMIGGVIVGGGTASSTVMVRGLGPSLTRAGVSNALADPTLELHDGNDATLITNDNWKVRFDGTSQQADIEATSIPPTNEGPSNSSQGMRKFPRRVKRAVEPSYRRLYASTNPMPVALSFPRTTAV